MFSLHRVHVAAALLAAGMIVPCHTASAAVWDFESETAGQAAASYSSLLYFNTGFHTLDIVDSGTTPQDPFAASGNKSLRARDVDGTGSSNFEVSFKDSEAHKQGVFSTRIYLQDDVNDASDYQFFQVILENHPGGVTEGGFGTYFNYFNERGTLLALTAGTNVVTFVNSIPHNTIIDFVVYFDTDANAGVGQYSATINGTWLEDSEGNTAFSLWNPLSDGVSAARITHARSDGDNRSSTTFYDDITLVPEPSVAALMSLGMLALGGRRARRA